MGYMLSTIANLPYDEKDEFYIFIVGGKSDWKGGMLENVYNNFEMIARGIGPRSKIAKGLKPADWAYELSR